MIERMLGADMQEKRAKAISKGQINTSKAMNGVTEKEVPAPCAVGYTICRSPYRHIRYVMLLYMQYAMLYAECRMS